MYVSVPELCNTHGSHKRVPDLLELNLLASMWVLVELVSFHAGPLEEDPVSLTTEPFLLFPNVFLS